MLSLELSQNCNLTEKSGSPASSRIRILGFLTSGGGEWWCFIWVTGLTWLMGRPWGLALQGVLYTPQVVWWISETCLAVPFPPMVSPPAHVLKRCVAVVRPTAGRRPPWYHNLEGSWRIDPLLQLRVLRSIGFGDVDFCHQWETPLLQQKSVIFDGILSSMLHEFDRLSCGLFRCLLQIPPWTNHFWLQLTINTLQQLQHKKTPETCRPAVIWCCFPWRNLDRLVLESPHLEVRL